jgi:hypothetical protein
VIQQFLLAIIPRFARVKPSQRLLEVKDLPRDRLFAIAGMKQDRFSSIGNP